ncbi:MAG TPA: M20/M25/M40 family metallo-hydrolase, partial [Thermoanaerobaculia bacterium]|nr:M20/M25/M40 family metallo-hydrolase [Thermoanaerobaculia bacterium]
MTGRQLLAVTALLGAILAFASIRLRGPAPLPATADAGRFSAGRARPIAEDLLREGVPHPVGSAANRVIRDRIAERFRILGYQVVIDARFVCNATPACATVENLFAHQPGHPGPWTLLVAHYDSVPAGPGASDDGAGVAVLLESARALRDRPGIAFLVTDGEEAGLLGAEAFVQSPLAKNVRAVVNVEYRGTSGPSFLFET